MTAFFFHPISQVNARVPMKNIQDVFEPIEASGADTLLLSAVPAPEHTQGHVGLSYGLDAFSAEYPSLNAYPDISISQEPASLKSALTSDTTAVAAAATAVDVPAVNNANQEQIAALVNSREKEVSELQATLAVPLAAFNAKFIWHCIMNIERDCEPAFVEKVKNIHRTFYLPPAIAFYALWLHFRFWHQLRQVYFTVEALLPAPTSSTAALGKEARVSLMIYMLAASFANKHLDDFSYRNSSWYEAAHLTPSAFLQMELLALQELQWSLEISAKDWSNWLLHLRTSNITLERTRPTTQTYHFVVARLIQDAILEAGLEKEELIRMGISPSVNDGATHGRLSFGMKRNGGMEMNKMSWNETSPTLVASSQGSSPPAGEGLHARVNVTTKNIADGPYGLYALQRKLENAQREAIMNPRSDIKYIPWDTTLDPVVHVNNNSGLRSRSGSGSAGRLSGDMTMMPSKGMGLGGNNCVYDSSMGGPAGGMMNTHTRHASYGQWPRQSMDGYAGNGGMVTTCADVLGRGAGMGYDYAAAGLKGVMTIRPLKTCNTVGLAQEQGYESYPGFDPAFPTSWPLRL